MEFISVQVKWVGGGGGGEYIRCVQLSVHAGVPSSFRECDLKSLLRLTSFLCSLKYLRYRKME